LISGVDILAPHELFGLGNLVIYCGRLCWWSTAWLASGIIVGSDVVMSDDWAVWLVSSFVVVLDCVGCNDGGSSVLDVIRLGKGCGSLDEIMDILSGELDVVGCGSIIGEKLIWDNWVMSGNWLLGKSVGCTCLSMTYDPVGLRLSLIDWFIKEILFKIIGW
jgi:hypothetical protein